MAPSAPSPSNPGRAPYDEPGDPPAQVPPSGEAPPALDRINTVVAEARDELTLAMVAFHGGLTGKALTHFLRAAKLCMAMAYALSVPTLPVEPTERSGVTD